MMWWPLDHVICTGGTERESSNYMWKVSLMIWGIPRSRQKVRLDDENREEGI